ncbi:MAG: hypothetical protein ABIJ94_01850 [candidate division WOR-3 bacterium]
MEKITWKAPEYEHIEKDKGFTITVLVVFGLLFLWRAWRHDFTLSLLIALAGLLVILLGHKKPKERTFTLTDKGVYVDQDFHPYDEFSSFYVFHEPPIQEISFLKKHTIFPHFHIPLGEQNYVLIQNFLKKYLPEKPHRYPLSDLIARFLGF